MEDNKKDAAGDDEKIRIQRQAKSFKLSQLRDYKNGYTSDDFLVDLITDVGLALEHNHVREARAFRNLDRRIRLPGVLIADVFDEQER